MTAAIRLISGKSPTVLEFFAGIGLARAGLEQAGFSVAWANDYEAKKHQLYRSQYGSDTDYHVGDIADINGSHLPTDSAIAGLPHPALTCPWLGIEMVLAEDSQERFGTLCGFSKRWVIVALPSQSSKTSLA